MWQKAETRELGGEMGVWGGQGVEGVGVGRMMGFYPGDG